MDDLPTAFSRRYPFTLPLRIEEGGQIDFGPFEVVDPDQAGGHNADSAWVERLVPTPTICKKLSTFFASTIPDDLDLFWDEGGDTSWPQQDRPVVAGDGTSWVGRYCKGQIVSRKRKYSAFLLPHYTTWFRRKMQH